MTNENDIQTEKCFNCGAVEPKATVHDPVHATGFAHQVRTRNGLVWCCRSCILNPNSRDEHGYAKNRFSLLPGDEIAIVDDSYSPKPYQIRKVVKVTKHSFKDDTGTTWRKTSGEVWNDALNRKTAYVYTGDEEDKQYTHYSRRSKQQLDEKQALRNEVATRRRQVQHIMHEARSLEAKLARMTDEDRLALLALLKKYSTMKRPGLARSF